jgi:hypothetical protein
MIIIGEVQDRFPELLSGIELVDTFTPTTLEVSYIDMEEIK